MNRRTIEETRERVKKVHGDTVVLDESTYFGTKIKAKFIDSVYGEWYSKPVNVLKGCEHPKRSSIKIAEARRLPLNEIKLRIKKAHGDIVLLDETTYTGKISKVKCRFVHTIYGEWWSTIERVMSGCGHPNGENEKRKQTFIKNYGVDHPNKTEAIKRKIGLKNTKSIKEIKKIIKKIYGNEVTMVDSTYVNATTKATFFHKIYGFWKALPTNVLKGHISPKASNDKRMKTCLDRYGAPFLAQVPEIALKQAKTSNRSSVKNHWKTGEELVCQGSYESKVVDYLNSRQINFVWQPKTFTMPNGRTYRPDLLLSKTNVWVEIKGYMREDAQKKWDWFKSEHPTAELWDKKKLKEMGIL
jgi:hypothetical protein